MIGWLLVGALAVAYMLPNTIDSLEYEAYLKERQRRDALYAGLKHWHWR
jgi:hypothetical protein